MDDEVRERAVELAARLEEERGELRHAVAHLDGAISVLKEAQARHKAAMSALQTTCDEIEKLVAPNEEKERTS